MDFELKKQLDRINAKLTALGARQKEHWVSVGWITSLTGWDHEKLRQAREEGIIQFRRKRDKNSYEYLLESIPDVFLINRSQQSAAISNELSSHVL